MAPNPPTAASRPARPHRNASACPGTMVARARGGRRAAAPAGTAAAVASGHRRAAADRGAAAAARRTVRRPSGGPGGTGPAARPRRADRQAAGLYPLPRCGGGPRGRFTGGRGLALIGLAVVALWLASGIYRVQPDEQGVVLRFGAFNRTTLPGLNYHLPWPIERVLTPGRHPDQPDRDRLSLRRRRADRQPATSGGRDVLEESLMLTGDENIIDIDFAVFWRISNAVAYLFNTRNPPLIVKAVAESSMREVIGRTPIQPALTELRAQIETDVLHQTQEILDHYKAGRRDHPGAVAEGRSAGRGGRKLPRRAARQHRRRADAQRGRGLSQRHRAARARRRGAHRRRGAGRAAGVDRRGDRPDAALPVGAGGLPAGART